MSCCALDFGDYAAHTGRLDPLESLACLRQLERTGSPLAVYRTAMRVDAGAGPLPRGRQLGLSLPARPRTDSRRHRRSPQSPLAAVSHHQRPIAVNYYPFHIGDYVSATRHLSWDEDAAYRRLLDTYYTTEKPLPIDLRAVFRLVLATTDAQRQAVETVLHEFFERTDSGWVNRRAEQEIVSMQDKQARQAIKAEHESERMRRHRERRAELFTALRAVEVVPAWDIPMRELQHLHEAHCNAPVAHLQRTCNANKDVSCNAPATAIPTPTPTPTPTPIKERERAGAQPAPRKRSAPAQLEQPPDVDDQTWQDWQALRKAKKAPVTATVLTQARTESDKAGMPLAAFLRIWCARGSQGLQAAWLKDSERATNNGMSGMSFAQLDERDRRARWEEMTGRKWPNAPNAATAQEFSEAEIKGVTHEPTHQSH